MVVRQEENPPSVKPSSTITHHNNDIMVTSASLATSPPSASPSPSRALHSGVSVLEHLGDAEEMTSNELNNNDDATTNNLNNLNNNNQLLGGITTPAYALLVGVALESCLNNESKMLSIPLTSLPTTFGKEHETKDANFVGLTEYQYNNNNNNNTTDQQAEGAQGEGASSMISSSTNKISSGPKLSKSMCSIYYRDGEQGGKLGCYKKKKKAAAAAAAAVSKDNDGDSNIINDKNKNRIIILLCT